MHLDEGFFIIKTLFVFRDSVSQKANFKWFSSHDKRLILTTGKTGKGKTFSVKFESPVSLFIAIDSESDIDVMGFIIWHPLFLPLRVYIFFCRRDFVIFQEPGKPAINITDNNFKDKVRLNRFCLKLFCLSVPTVVSVRLVTLYMAALCLNSISCQCGSPVLENM